MLPAHHTEKPFFMQLCQVKVVIFDKPKNLKRKTNVSMTNNVELMRLLKSVLQFGTSLSLGRVPVGPRFLGELPVHLSIHA